MHALHTHIHTYTHTHKHTHICICMCVCVHTHTYTYYVCVCMCRRLHVRVVHAWVHVQYCLLAEQDKTLTVEYWLRDVDMHWVHVSLWCPYMEAMFRCDTVPVTCCEPEYIQDGRYACTQEIRITGVLWLINPLSSCVVWCCLHTSCMYACYAWADVCVCVCVCCVCVCVCVCMCACKCVKCMCVCVFMNLATPLTYIEELTCPSYETLLFSSENSIVALQALPAWALPAFPAWITNQLPTFLRYVDWIAELTAIGCGSNLTSLSTLHNR